MLNVINCSQADIQRKYFEQIHVDRVEEILKSKFGEYASITCNTVGSEEGGYIVLSFGCYDLQDELTNFIPEICKILNLEKSLAERYIEYFINMYNVIVDVDWDEEPYKSSVDIYLKGENIKEMESYHLLEEHYREFLEALQHCISDFTNTTLKKASLDFSYSWMQEYTHYES